MGMLLTTIEGLEEGKQAEKVLTNDKKMKVRNGDSVPKRVLTSFDDHLGIYFHLKDFFTV